jgi:hypothetical protein
MDARLRLESTESFTKMAKESPIFAERFSVVDSPEEYYIIVAFLDLFEFLFRLNKRDMIDTEIWSHWKGLAETIMTIPKFKSVWEKTKDVHASEFRDFLDSFDNTSPRFDRYCNPREMMTKPHKLLNLSRSQHHVHSVLSYFRETLNCQYNHSCYNRHTDQALLSKINTNSENNTT